ncbi:MAG TPA: four helix bundle protein [Vitreimonas sp.]|nr:four helix bundle protein [Vitreimonas sp.]
MSTYPKVKSYKDLIVWQKSMQLCFDIYAVTNVYPRTEMFGLTSQMRRASVSVASNIAEGCGRSKKMAEYHQFLRYAYASAVELETQLIISHHLNYIKTEKFTFLESNLTEILKILNKILSYQAGNRPPHYLTT